MLASPSVPRNATQALAADLASALDPVVFARRAGIEPDSWQADVLRSADRRILLNCSRQSGKSTTTAIIGLHRAIYTPGSLILLLSPSLRQSAELFRTLARLYTSTGATVPSTAESRLRLELENGSRVISLPASAATIRGYAGVDLLIVDEASRVEDPLYHSVRPMLATSNGRLVALSTPYGRRGWWSDAWHSSHAWMRVRVTADQCPRIPPAFLAEERENIGAFWFDQEYMCQFVDNESQAFSTEDARWAMVGEEVEQWQL